MPIFKCDADQNTVVHMGSGDVVITTSLDLTEVILTPADSPGELGERTEQYDGKPSDAIPPGVRLAFDNAVSVEVLMEALAKVARSLNTTTRYWCEAGKHEVWQDSPPIRVGACAPSYCDECLKSAKEQKAIAEIEANP